MTESRPREFWIDEGANGFDLGFVRRWVAEFPHKDSLVDQEHIHVIEKSFADKLQAELDRFKTLYESEARKKDEYAELLRECEKVLEKYETMICVSGPGLTQKEMWAARTMLAKLREG